MPTCQNEKDLPGRLINFPEMKIIDIVGELAFNWCKPMRPIKCQLGEKYDQ
jgi:hypothetical protein